MNANEAIKAAYTVAESRGFKVLSIHERSTKKHPFTLPTQHGFLTRFILSTSFDIETNLENLNKLEQKTHENVWKQRVKIADELTEEIEKTGFLAFVQLLANGFRVELQKEG